MTPKQAISALKNRLEKYAAKHSSNYDYICETAEIINALIDLYNECETRTKEVVELRKEIVRAKSIIAHFGINHKVLEVHDSLLMRFSEVVYVPNYMYEMYGSHEAVKRAMDMQDDYMVDAHNRILMQIDYELLARTLSHHQQIRESLLIPPLITKVEDMYNYLAERYGEWYQ